MYKIQNIPCHFFDIVLTKFPPPNILSFMKVSGIIAEYNPFHRGHQYHMEATRKATGADYLIVVMSGNFTQRGDAAIMDKFSRAQAALEQGADLVLELPACFATASARHFACGGVSLLEKLGVVDSLSFGSEDGLLDSILACAEVLKEEPNSYRTLLQSCLGQGFSYPRARAMALTSLFPHLSEAAFSSPNNILGLEYCLALRTFNSKIRPVTIQRIHNNYHDSLLSDKGCSSATAIRGQILGRQPEAEQSTLKNQLPDCTYRQLETEYGKTMPVSMDDFSSLLHYKLLTTSREQLQRYADVSSDLADRIYNHRLSFTSFEAFCDLLKTKQLTRSRISRCLVHILLDIEEAHMREYKEAAYSLYGRILGFRRESAPLLHAIKANAAIPLISKLADAGRLLDPLSLRMLETDIRSTQIYESLISHKFGSPFRNELSRPFPIR